MAYTPQRVFQIHLAIIGVLALANAGAVALSALGHHHLLGFGKLLNPGIEQSIPTLVSVLALFAVTFSAWSIRAKLPAASNERRGWTIFAFTFAFLAFDEGLQIHEAVSNPYGFVGTLIYVVLVVPFGLIMFQFWLRQPPSIRLGMLGAGILYIVAAVLLEAIEMAFVQQFGMSWSSLWLRLIVAAEEFGEMLAVAWYLRLFLTRYAMLGGGPLLQLEIRAGGRSKASVEEVPKNAYA